MMCIRDRRKAVVKAQETIGANRQKMVDELGHWEEWRDLSKQIRNHVLANLDAYLYQLSEKVMENGGKVYFAEDVYKRQLMISCLSYVLPVFMKLIV